MEVKLIYIEVMNFKSYKGYQRIGPLLSFEAVIGPNGSGKSNFMDAVSFVMGEKTQCLRVKRLGDLIHGASVNRPVSDRASVVATFEGSEKKKFMRSIVGSSSEYRIDDERVSFGTYMKELKNLGINVEAKNNFLIPQGTVESIALKNPKELTALFEEISGSGTLKNEYNRLKSEMTEAEENVNLTFKKKKTIGAECKAARLEKEKAINYSELKENMKEKRVEFQLFRLYYNDGSIKELEAEIKEKREEIKKIKKNSEKTENKFKETKKNHGKSQRELAKLESNIYEKENHIRTLRPPFIKSKERTAHIQKQIESASKSLKQATNDAHKHHKDINELENELKIIQRKKDKYEELVRSEYQSQGRDFELEQDQIFEYNMLKELTGKESSRHMADLDSISREQKSDQDRLDSEIGKKSKLESKLKTSGHELNEAHKRKEHLDERIKHFNDQIKEKEKMLNELEGVVGCSKDRISDVQKALDEVSNQLGGARIDKHEDNRRKKKQEIVENLKKLYFGVYDRIINMCQPIHNKYNVAITKQLGYYMEAIVVDSEATALHCIQYLKCQMLEPENFLPLDCIQAKPLNDRLRSIENPKGVKLIYDVLRYDPPDIKKAILFVTNNALVCESLEDAMTVAYELSFSQRFNAVALDGSFCSKSGIISGGSADLARKAKRWNDKQVSMLTAKKEKLTEELKQVVKNSRKESEIQTIKSEISTFKTCLIDLVNDKKSSIKKITKLLENMEKMRRELECFEPVIRAIEKFMRERDARIKDMKEKINKVEDDIFAEFCGQIGVSNIRQYEEGELKSLQDHEKKKIESENEIKRIQSQLEYERMRETQLKDNVTKYERMIQDNEDALEVAKNSEQSQMAKIDEHKHEVDSVKQRKAFLKSECDRHEEAVNEARREVAVISMEIHSWDKKINELEIIMESERATRHSILKQCRMDVIDIPITKGDWKDTEEDQDSSDVSTSHTSSVIYEKNNDLIIDYTNLQDNLKMLEVDDVKITEKSLEKHIYELQCRFDSIQFPNMRAAHDLDAAEDKFIEINNEFEVGRKRAKNAKINFERVKKDRHDLFIKCFDHVSNKIDEIYKQIAANYSAQAFLGPENPEEPYLEGIIYNCIAPGKQYQPMSSLSGGEKTIAALALLFAIHSFQSAPFFIVDEIDAALDITNIRKVASYIEKITGEGKMNIIVISLKVEFFHRADKLIGIAPNNLAGENVDCLTSKVFTLDLRLYPK